MSRLWNTHFVKESLLAQRVSTPKYKKKTVKHVSSDGRKLNYTRKKRRIKKLEEEQKNKRYKLEENILIGNNSTIGEQKEGENKTKTIKKNKKTKS